ncbi:MAG: hypothetical protein M1820_000377 [Bogoriella megaspora]|nr:MAG: hypothetical protein M1820_000377 [Bogoriella megaspora]
MDSIKKQHVFALALLIFSPFIVAQGPSFSPLLPHSYPLAVRNPYLSAWLPGNQAADLPSAVPQTWSSGNLTWSVLARVDGTSYSLFGAPGGPQAASVVSGEYTSTRTVFALSAGDAKFILDFLSPVAPDDYVRQSLPFSYLTVSATGANGKTPSVQVYTDIDDTWLGTDTSNTYNISTTGSTSLFQWAANTPEVYTESQKIEQALWGTLVYATRPGCNNETLTSASGAVSDVRNQFTGSGKLDNSNPEWVSGSVTAFSHDLGSVSTGSNVTYAIGLARDQVVNYVGQDWTHFYRATYADPPAAVDHFLDDYAGASADALALDAAISSAANTAGGSNYSEILALSVRQAYGSCDFSILDSSKDTSDPLIFFKELSSDGNVNTVDVAFPMHPIFYVLNAASIRDILEPVTRFLKAGGWPENYAVHDIGRAYPNAIGPTTDNPELMEIEESGNVLITAYAYQLATGDTEWVSGYQSLFQTYADYLRANGTNIKSQLSSDDGVGPTPNQTTLGIKAAVGLKAYGAMFQDDNYTQAGDDLADLLYNQTLGTDTQRSHFTRLYPDQTDTWTTTYNLFPDKLLNLNTFSQAAYDMQSSYYSTIRSDAGVALNDNTDWGKTDWMLFSGAIASQDTRTMFVNDVHNYIVAGKDTIPFSDRYFVRDNSSDGAVANQYFQYAARPVVGGHFALLALDNGPNSIQLSKSQGGGLCPNGDQGSSSSSTSSTSGSATSTPPASSPTDSPTSAPSTSSTTSTEPSPPISATSATDSSTDSETSVSSGLSSVTTAIVYTSIVTKSDGDVETMTGTMTEIADLTTVWTSTTTTVWWSGTPTPGSKRRRHP